MKKLLSLLLALSLSVSFIGCEQPKKPADTKGKEVAPDPAATPPAEGDKGETK